MRNHKLPPDNRLDWRDPNMPCLRTGMVDNVVGLHSIDPDSIKNYYARKMTQYDFDVGPPSYKDDPSYWWNKRNK